MAVPAVDRPGWRGAIVRFCRRSYLADYLGYALLLAAYTVLVLSVDPFHRLFSLDDRSISYPHADIQRVSALQNIIYAGVFPLSFFILWAILLRPGWHKAHVTVLGFIISITLATFLTDLVKNAVGRPRPDLIARCKPSSTTPTHELVGIEVCTETDHHTLHDGWRSFPSGHSSFSFSGLGYLSLWLAGQLRVFRPRTDLARVLVSLAPALGALMIAVSRLEDYRHDVYDVTAGSLLGISIAWASYRRYFRPFQHVDCDEPYPSKAVLDKQTPRRDVEARPRFTATAAEEFELADISGDEEDEAAPLNAGRRDRDAA